MQYKKYVPIFWGLIFLFFSCQKVEYKFPLGHYQFDIKAHQVGNTEKEWNSLSPAEVLSRADDLIQIQTYHIKAYGDTIFGKIHDLNISQNEVVTAVFKGTTSTVTLSEGIIHKRSKKDFVIKGKINGMFWVDHGDHYQWDYYQGTYLFEQVQ